MTYELDDSDISEIEAGLRQIERALGRRRPAGRYAPADPSALRAKVLGAARELDARDRMGGMVPLPDLRAALRASGASASRAEVDAALLGLEREGALDLLVAQSPTTVPDRAAGIERPGRGLVYYVAPRQDAGRKAPR